MYRLSDLISALTAPLSAGRREAGRSNRTKLRRCLPAIVMACAVVGLLTEMPHGQAGSQGQWTTLPGVVPVNPVHMALMHNGKVLIVSGSGNVATQTNFRSVVWDPATNTYTDTPPVGWDMFCNGMVALADGRIFVNGGTLKYDPFWGEPRNAVFDPDTGQFTDVENMLHGRWYPTVTVLGDGRVMTFSGLKEAGGTNTAVELYTAGSGWSPEYQQAVWTPPLYPRMHLLPDGRVIYSGSGVGTRVFNVSTKTWSGVIASTIRTSSRTYGTSVLLPLSPADGYKGRVLILGGGNPATKTTEVIDMSAANPQWQSGPPMSQERIELNATILPSGRVLATGGSLNDEDAATASKNADLYDPGTNTFSPAGLNAFARLYHSNALLLPDATVLLAGGNPQRGSYEGRLEVYAPAYLFTATGAAAARPTILNVTPNPVGYGATFQVQTPEAASISSVVLVRPGAATHAFDMEQRLVRLSYSAVAGGLEVTAPPNGNIAPPGYYMLFILNAAGVPSVAKFVQVMAVPDFDLSPLPTSRTITAGGTATYVATVSAMNGFNETVTFGVSGLPAGATATFTPPSVTASGTTDLAIVSAASTPAGTYPLTVTGTSATRTHSTNLSLVINASGDFSLSASPTSRTITAGGTATYVATVSAMNGFNETVTFGVSGLPAGVTATFTPPSVTASGTTDVTIVSTASTPAGTYPLTMTGTSATRTHSTTISLVVNASGDFSLSALPTSRTITAGGTATYVATVSAMNGFNETVTFGVSGLPAGVTATFTPPSVTASGTTDVTIVSAASTPAGTYPLTVTGTSATRTHSTTISLVVNASGDFSLSALPTSRTITAGGTATYTATVAAINGFNETVTFGVSGLPAGATAAFTPPSVTASGTTDVTIVSAASTPAGTYPLTVTGTSATRTHSTTISLVVNASGDFSLSALPTSRTITAGGTATYVATVSAINGFNETVTFGVSGLPAGATAAFTPPSVTASGTTDVTIVSAASTPAGTYPLTVTGTSATRTHSTTISLVVNAGGTFVVSVAPQLRTIAKAGGTTYTGNGDIRGLHRYDHVRGERSAEVCTVQVRATLDSRLRKLRPDSQHEQECRAWQLHVHHHGNRRLARKIDHRNTDSSMNRGWNPHEEC